MAMSIPNSPPSLFTSDNPARNLMYFLHAASGSGNVSNARKMIAHGFKVNEKNADDVTPLYIAAGSRSLEMVKMFVNIRAQVNIKCMTEIEGGHTALMHAAQMGSVDIVEFLLASRADGIFMNHHHTAAIHLAAEEGHYEIVKILIECGQFPSQMWKKRQSPLLRAAQHGHTKIIEYLLRILPEQGAQQILDEALTGAIDGQNCDCVKLLLDQGAGHYAPTHNPNAASYPRESLGLANRHNKLVQAAAYDNVQVVQALLDKGASPNSAWKSQTPMWVTKNADILRVLIAYGGDINNKLHFGIPLSFTRGILPMFCQSENEACVRVLLETGADPDVYPSSIEQGSKPDPHWKYMTPLITCVENDNPDLVDLLLQYGADINRPTVLSHLVLRDDESTPAIETREELYTPIQCALAIGNARIVQSLVLAGMDPDSILEELKKPPLEGDPPNPLNENTILINWLHEERKVGPLAAKCRKCILKSLANAGNCDCEIQSPKFQPGLKKLLDARRLLKPVIDKLPLPSKLKDDLLNFSNIF